MDYEGIARGLMESLSKKELKPMPHYRVLLASREDDISKVWETGVERHEIGYSFVDTADGNDLYTTTLTGYVRVGSNIFVPLRIDVWAGGGKPLKIEVYSGEELQSNYRLHKIRDDKVLVEIPFYIDVKDPTTEYLSLEITKRVRQTTDGNSLHLRIRNITRVKRFKSRKSFEFGHILEFRIKERSKGQMRIPLNSYKGYSLLPAVDTQSLAGTAGAVRSSPKEAFEDVYIVVDELEFLDYHVSTVQIPRIKPSGMKISELSREVEAETGMPLHRLIREYVEEKIEGRGSTLYRFQAEGIRQVTKQLKGHRKPVLITAKTAAGKTESFMLPVVNYVLHLKEGQPGRKGVRAILMYPTKALANDQLQRIFDLVAFVNSRLKEDQRITVGVYHGDIGENAVYEIPMPLKCVDPIHGDENPRLKMENGVLTCPKCGRRYDFLLVDRKSILSSPPDILIATPDILNYALAFDRERHVLFHSNDGISPEIVVLDELHLFYSIFGKNVSLMLKRLEGMVRHYTQRDWKIQFIGASATIKNPKRFGSAFFGSDVVHVSTEPFDYDYDNPIRKTMIFAMPLAYKMVDTATYSIITLLQLVGDDFKTLVFVNTLAVCDMIKSNLSRRASSSPELKGLIEKIGTHNSNLTKQERAEIEEKFNRGKLSVLVATSTLEVGVDFKDIDLLMLYGVPYSFNSYLQRVGRAGRSRDTIVYVLLNPSNPIDITYYREALKIVLNPEVFIEYPPFPERNRVLERKHLVLAISDICTALGLDVDEVLSRIVSGDIASVGEVVNHVVGIGLVSSAEGLSEAIEEVYSEAGEGSPFEKIKEKLRLADIRTAESVVSVSLDVYDPKYMRSSRRNRYKRYGFTDRDMEVLRKIKGGRRV